MKIEASTREEYFSKAGEREADLRALDAMICKSAPHLKPVLGGGMSGKMLGYGEQKYKTKSAKEAIDWPIVMLAAQKNYMSLYVCAVQDGAYVAELYEKRLGKVSCGKSCIRFKNIQDLNLEVIHEMLAKLDERVARGEKLYGE